MRIGLILLGLVVFVAGSLAVGRVLAARGAERSLLEGVIRDQAKGDSAALAAGLPACGAGTKCRAQTEALVAKVSGPGKPLEILQITGGVGSGPGPAEGVARIAWHTGGGLPVVQCVAVKKSGSVISGFSLKIVKVSNPIAREGACPGVVNLIV